MYPYTMRTVDETFLNFYTIRYLKADSISIEIIHLTESYRAFLRIAQIDPATNTAIDIWRCFPIAFDGNTLNKCVGSANAGNKGEGVDYPAFVIRFIHRSRSAINAQPIP
jgi:hypothetical protein